jgi:SAM-dependent methyltransferase
MAGAGEQDTWNSGDNYDLYVGRWSQHVADVFVRWLGIQPERSWLDVGSGTGAIISLILVLLGPAMVVGLDPSSAYLSFSRHRVDDSHVALVAGSSQAMPFRDESFDVVVSGLALNFFPEPSKGIAEMARVTRSGGTVAAYVWDYAGAMEYMRTFWDTAIALDARALALDEGRRFSICHPEPLMNLFRDASLHDIEVRFIDVPMHFACFDDYWRPFLGGQGPAPTYVSLIDDELRAALREQLRATLPIAADGSIDLTARAWAVRGTR